MVEEWRPVPGWETLYEVSDQGRVRSLPRTTRTGSWEGRVRKPNILKSGHLQVALWKESRRTTLGIHVLVMAAFVGPRPEGQEVRHLDGNPANNTLLNLTYGTRSDQRMDDVRNGTHPTASKTHCPQGHPYSGENLYIQKTDGARRCRTCMRESRRKWQSNNRDKTRQYKANWRGRVRAEKTA